MSERFNGWSNRETYLVHLWISNDEPSMKYWEDNAVEAWDEAAADRFFSRKENAARHLAERLKDVIMDGAGELGLGLVYGDLLRSALEEVNWGEVAKALLDGAADILRNRE